MAFKYDIEYWEKMLRQNSATAELIAKKRWTFVKEANAKKVLDYGSGPGWFRAFRPKNIIVDSYDINPWPQTGFRETHYDLITFWDVLEHFRSLEEPFKIMRKFGVSFVAISCPALKPGIELKKWKHWKPGEHFHYKTAEEWDLLFKENGYKKIKGGEYECPPRSDIYSALYAWEEKTKK